MLQMNLAENIQRSSLTPLERAKAFRRLMQLEDLTASEVAARMNVSQRHGVTRPEPARFARIAASQGRLGGATGLGSLLDRSCGR